MNKISIIIPILNEIDVIHQHLNYLSNAISNKINYEIIVVDGGSDDGSQNAVRNHQYVQLLHANRGRAHQLNAGAKAASGSILYFLHCDSFPPKNFDIDILNQIEIGNNAGCFRMKFDSYHPVLLISQWFTRVNHISCRGGDQSLFVTKELFECIQGYDEKHIIYEDNEIITRIYKKDKFIVIPKYLITSSRRYRLNGFLKLQFHFAFIHLKVILGHSKGSILKYYLKHVK